MKKNLIIFLILGLSLSSCAQKPKYKTISSWVQFYEFNASRNKIYFYDYNKILSVYDINKQTTTIVDTGLNAETMFFDSPLFCYNGYMYLITEYNILKIKDEKIINKIPIIFYEYHYGSIDAESIKFEENKMKKLNKIISDYNDNDIQRFFGNMHEHLHNNLIILNYKDKNPIAFYAQRLRKRNNLNPENKTKIENIQRLVYFVSDTSYTIKHAKNGAINYFENKKITIQEKSYSCRKQSFMSLVSLCKYAIYITNKNKTFKLKNNKRDSRISLVNGETFSVNLNKKLPNSRYITDKNGDIYLIFGKELNFIKIPKNQFN